MANVGSFDSLRASRVNLHEIVADFEQEEEMGAHIVKETRTCAYNAANSLLVDANPGAIQASARQQMWLDHFYSSHEQLDKIWLQFEVWKYFEQLHDLFSGSMANIKNSFTEGT